MTNKIKSFGKIFGFIALVLFVYLFFLPFTPLLIGAVITGGILGNVTGKVGGVVGGMWKGINYLRAYVIPANPQSVDQTTQRTRFSVIQEYVRQVLATLVHGYWDMYQVGQSGYNAIMSNWMLTADVNNLLSLTSKAAKGTLAPQPVSSVMYNPTAGYISFSWTEALTGNQLSTDKLKLLIFDKSSGLLYFDDSSTPRSIETRSFTILTGLTFGNLTVYSFFVQGSGSTMIVSDSVAQIATLEP